jgi:hypothetical protein
MLRERLYIGTTYTERGVDQTIILTTLPMNKQVEIGGLQMRHTFAGINFTSKFVKSPKGYGTFCNVRALVIWVCMVQSRPTKCTHASLARP